MAALARLQVALLLVLASLIVAGTDAVASPDLTFYSAMVDESGQVTFTLGLSLPPDFVTVDAAGDQRDAFQWYIVGDRARPYPANYDAIIRGSEIHLSPGLLPIRYATPPDYSDPASGGWGPVRTVVPFVLDDATVTFTVPLTDLSDHIADGPVEYELVLASNGVETYPAYGVIRRSCPADTGDDAIDACRTDLTACRSSVDADVHECQESLNLCQDQCDIDLRDIYFAHEQCSQLTSECRNQKANCLSCTEELASEQDALAECTPALAAAQDDVASCTADLNTCGGHAKRARPNLFDRGAYKHGKPGGYGKPGGPVGRPSGSGSVAETCPEDLSECQDDVAACHQPLDDCEQHVLDCQHECPLAIASANAGLMACRDDLNTCYDEASVACADDASCHSNLATAQASLFSCEMNLESVQEERDECRSALAVCHSCGNGVVDAGETCDDGNTLAGDCCSSACQVAPNGETCSDGDACTHDDTCTGGVCVAGLDVDCGACETCDAHLGCVAAPRPVCHQPTARFSGELELGNHRTDTLSWTWSKGTATSLADFGDPLRGDGYTLCLYDESGATPHLAWRAVTRRGLCGARPCWKRSGKSAFRYKDATQAVDGLDSVLLKSGAKGKSEILVNAKGPHLILPPLPMALPLHMQLQAENGQCWEARYFGLGKAHNDARHFKAKAFLP